MKLRMATASALAAALLSFPVAAQERPGPPPELKKLSFLVGKASGDGQFFPAAGPPLKFTLVQEGRWIAEGWYLQQQVKSIMDGETTEQVFLLGYDPQSREYRAWDFGPGRGLPTEWGGKFDGDRLVMEMRGGGGRKTGGMAARLDVKPDRRGPIRIARVDPNGPAARAGVKDGDLITRVDGKSLEDVPNQEVSRLLRGDPGTRVRITLIRDGKEREVEVRREQLSRRMILQPREGSGYSIVSEAGVGGRYTEKTAEEVLRGER